MAETSSLDDALKAEVVELRAALSEASEAHRAQQSAHYELTIRLEAAEAVAMEREAQFTAKRAELESKLHTSEEGFKVGGAGQNRLIPVLEAPDFSD